MPSVFKPRIEQLEKLKEDLLKRDPQSKIPILNYLQLLDYHLTLLRENHKYVEAIERGDEVSVTKWYKNRIKNDELHTTNSEVTQ